MRATRLAFTALDGIAAARGETAEEIVNFAGCDVLCYRAVGPASFVAKQARLWDPVLEWAGRDLGVTLTKTTGVIHYAQPQTSLDRVRELARDQTDFGLAGLAFATALFGSAVLALAVQAGQLDGLEAFALSRLDEAFQEEQWGIDAEAAERTARLELDATMIGIWFESLR